jgi:hypothetical protein
LPLTVGVAARSPKGYNLANNDPKVLTFMSKAFATMVVQMAFDTKVMSASNSTVFDKKLPIAGETGRRLAAR